ncbi:MAG: TrkH family potassium uptake protein [Vicinamibacterales bacterium]|jgi:trk system potassium uptake protein TrkH|nr:potassium transporter [Acidobacteriota bacterium]MDP6372882.1 TrkH family potassium uptake protein [Vicinamibacterales bacterium]MDP6609709.1 TrkH family potassium uptake protein [Vicinamibacterales bacterium]HAK54849.1 potassium transporter [Acidobacteriota bacterium]|tara:strand:+ start:5893 stop:7350 length:1458 start_codon:yes stop_codon:yes gene_type:complete
MRLAIVLHLTGTILRVFGAAFLAPLLVALYYGETADAIGFVSAGVLAAAAGQVMRRRVDGREWVLRRVEGMAVVAGTWLLVAVIGSVPYAVAGLGAVDALFESMSGITATGATIFTDFGVFGRGLLFWRSMSQWLGGMGVITLFIAVLPRLAIGGRQLFFTEAPGPTDDGLTPQVRKTAGLLWRLYAGLTLAEFVALRLAGMSAFDAICHAMTTIAAGGFSPNPESVMGYNSAAVEWIICGFMFLAGANFALQYRALRGRPRALFGDDEFRVYAGIVLVAAVALTGFLVQAGTATVVAVRAGLFQTLSILTTTGYASEDFALWNDQARLVLLVLMFIGGCAGSAAGGPKVVRQVLLARYTLLELKKTLHPRAVLPVKLGGKVVPDDVMRAVLVFFLFYLLAFAVCVGLVVALGADIVTGITAATGALGNIGPGFNQVGPMSSYADLHPISKVVLTMAMWVGRLEVLTVLALLRPEVWQSVTLRAD